MRDHLMRSSERKKEFQLKFNKVNGWGGRRRGSGRPNTSGLVNHMARPKVNFKLPLHVTLRLRKKLPSLRNKTLFNEFKKSVIMAKAFGLYVIHFSIQTNHVHLLVEARDNDALSLGMRSLCSRFAKIIRRQAAAKGFAPQGSVFTGRYHLHALKTPNESRNALEYVLLNLSKHQKLIEYIDEYSSGWEFLHWKTLMNARFYGPIKADAEFWMNQRHIGDKHTEMPRASHLNGVHVLSQPRSWLLKFGWMKNANGALEARKFSRK